MSAFEGSFKSLLQGVSQQEAELRQDGQVEIQENMLSDVATGLRRRPGIKYLASAFSGTITSNKFAGWYADLGGQKVHVMLDVAAGAIRVYDDNFTTLADLTSASGYLQTADAANISVATVGDEMFFCNNAQLPGGGPGTIPGGLDSNAYGYFNVVAGAFNTKYTVRLVYKAGVDDVSLVASYTTPSGAGAGDAALTTPEYIAGQLGTILNSATAPLYGMSCATTISGTSVFVRFIYTGTQAYPISILADTAKQYIVASGAQYADSESLLPDRLPAGANGFTMAVGSKKTPTYYSYDTVNQRWLEIGKPGSPSYLSNLPVGLRYNGTSWVLSTGLFEGRLAGDDTSNPLPKFVQDTKINGIAAYQGRLVILTGSTVCMSAAGKPRRFFRSTVTTLLDGDNIEIGASANSSASYSHAVQYNKDLLLFSSGYQAVIPNSNTGISPRNATVVVTSQYEAGVAKPIIAGRSLLYSAPRSGNRFGILEMVPSQSTEAQYVSNDATAHLPDYMLSSCRFMSSSGMSGLCVFQPTQDKRTLIVHEYLWSGDQKIQQAWHKWTFPADVATAYFAKGLLYVVFVQNLTFTVGSMDPRQIADTGNTLYPFADLYSTWIVSGNQFYLPVWLTSLVPDKLDNLSVTVGSGPNRGEPIGFTRIGNLIQTDASFPSGSAILGISYESKFRPTSPVVKDQNGIVISSNKLTLLRYIADTARMSDFTVDIADVTNRSTPDTYDMSALRWDSEDLVLGAKRLATESTAIIPARINADTGTVTWRSVGTREMNLTTLSYVCRTKQKIRRR